MDKTTVINLLGGPGAGKSTLAADLYAKMKRKGMNVELVREVAKEWAWQGHYIGPFEQLSILGEQIKRESTLYTKVDYIITDSPVVLGAFYCGLKGQSFVNHMVQDYYTYSETFGIDFFNYFIPRIDKYDSKGRYESEDEAKKIDDQLQDYLNYHDYDFRNLRESKEDACNIILSDLEIFKNLNYEVVNDDRN